MKIFDLGLKTLVYNTFSSIMELTSETNEITFNPKEIAIRKIAENRGKTAMEFINIWRTSMQFSWERQRSSVGRRGISTIYKTLDVQGTPTSKAGVITIKAVPVDLDYEVTFWSQSLDKLMQVAERYLFWQHMDPNLNISLDLETSGEVFPLEFDLHFGSIKDDSQIVEQYEKGRYFVYTMPIKIDGWVFTNLDIRTILHIYVKVYDFLKTEQEGKDHWRDVLLTEWEEHAEV